MATRARSQKQASKLTRKSAQNGTQKGAQNGPKRGQKSGPKSNPQFCRVGAPSKQFFYKIAFVWKVVLMPEPCVLHNILNIAPLAPKGHATRTRTPIAVEFHPKITQIGTKIVEKTTSISHRKTDPQKLPKIHPKGGPQKSRKVPKRRDRL